MVALINMNDHPLGTTEHLKLKMSVRRTNQLTDKIQYVSVSSRRRDIWSKCASDDNFSDVFTHNQVTHKNL